MHIHTKTDRLNLTHAHTVRDPGDAVQVVVSLTVVQEAALRPDNGGLNGTTAEKKLQL
jgi:hypothetical protein